MRAPRLRLERRLAFGVEAFDQGLHPEAADAVVPGHRTLVRPSTVTAVITSRASDMTHFQDQLRCQLCLGTAANYLVQPVTSRRTYVRN